MVAERSPEQLRVTTESNLDRPMVPRPHSGQLIFTCDLNAFSLSMALLVFVVLAMFLALGGNSHHGMGPLLPKAQHTRVLGYLNWGANRGDAMIAAVTRDGRIYFGAEQITSADDLPAKIRESISRGPERRVYITADARARYGIVKEVLQATQFAGWNRFPFFADDRTTHRPPKFRICQRRLTKNRVRQLSFTMEHFVTAFQPCAHGNFSRKVRGLGRSESYELKSVRGNPMRVHLPVLTLLTCLLLPLGIANLRL